MSSARKPLVLAVTYGAGHVISLLPVLGHLAVDDSIDLQVIGLSLAFEHLDRENIPSLGLSAFTHLFPEKAMEYGRELVKPSQVRAGLRLEDIQAYIGLAFWDLVQELGEDEAHEQYREQGRGGLMPVGVCRRILEEIKPDLVICSSAPRYERAFLLAADQVGIKSIILIDHMGITAVPWAGASRLGSKIAVISDFSKETLVKAGRPSEEVVVTGNPGFDRIFGAKAETAGKALRETPRFKGKKVVLFAAGSAEPSRPDLIADIYAELEKCADKHPDWQIVIRPHPNQLDPPLVDLKKLAVSDRWDPLEEILHASDVVLTLTSTVGIQAALIEKPVIQIELSEFLPGSPYAALGFAAGIKDVSDLESAIENATTCPTPTALTPLNSNSTESFVDLIHSVLQHSEARDLNLR